MDQSRRQQAPHAVRETVREYGDEAAFLGRSMSPIALKRAQALYAGYRVGIARPELFAVGRSVHAEQVNDLAERSIRAEFALVMGVSENAAARELDYAQLLVEELPQTRALLADAAILWECGQLICAAARRVPLAARDVYDWRAAQLAPGLRPHQLKKALARLVEELQDQPLAERHELAKERRTVWLTPEEDGMCVISALLPAPVALGAYDRLDSIAKIIRKEDEDDTETRSLAQLRADAFGDILLDGDINGTTPDSDDRARTFLPGVRAKVRIMVPVLTAAGEDEANAELDGYGPIPANMARELVGTGSDFYRVLTDPSTCAPISVERLKRFPPAEMRVFVQLRDLTCRFPGCVRPAAKAEIDHATEWVKGGHTAIRNLLTLCTSHHHVRHGEQWTYQLHPDSTAEWTSPTGRRVTTHPPEVPGATPGPRFRDKLFSEDPPPTAEQAGF
ncbi:DUF222 domain-containing protein [Microbacteriaceae bacterium VKM Ac-2854]|nr:DUF222 domain-containing protein [Microbacteriaceae bacterium VKM Ac-2854]